MLRQLTPRFEQSHRSGHLFIQNSGLLAVFQRSPYTEQPQGDSGAHIYTYGRIDADEAWSLDKTGNNDMLIPHYFGQLGREVRGNILVVPDKNVEAAIEEFTGPTHPEKWSLSTLGAQRLYKSIGGRMLNGELIESCATYSFADDRAQVVLVGASGGYSIGLPAAAEPESVALPALRGSEFYAG